jgi:hypothetical protein
MLSNLIVFIKLFLKIKGVKKGKYSIFLVRQLTDAPSDLTDAPSDLTDAFFGCWKSYPIVRILHFEKLTCDSCQSSSPTPFGCPF